MGLHRIPADFGIARDPGLREVVDNVMATMAAIDAVKASEASAAAAPAANAPQPRWSGPWPKGGLGEGFLRAQASQPFISSGNYGGAGWTAGRRMKLGELTRNDDFQVPPVDTYDEKNFCTISATRPVGRTCTAPWPRATRTRTRSSTFTTARSRMTADWRRRPPVRVEAPRLAGQ